MVMPSKTGPSIVVEVDGHLIVWTDGLLSGEKSVLAKIRENASYNATIRASYSLHPLTAQLTDKDDRVGIVAAMISPNAERAIIRELDEDTLRRIFTMPGESEESVLRAQGLSTSD